MSINTLTVVESLLPNNRSTNEAISSLTECEKKLKIMRIGVEEYTLDSINALLVSLCSYGKPFQCMKPSSLALTIYDTFVQSLVPLEDEKEGQAIRDQIYIEEDPVDKSILTTRISPKKYGKGY